MPTIILYIVLLFLQDNKLKLAVLDYLRRFCPGDNDIYRVVSSHFAMYREIADLLEQTAMKKLNAITHIGGKSQGKQIVIIYVFYYSEGVPVEQQAGRKLKDYRNAII